MKKTFNVWCQSLERKIWKKMFENQKQKPITKGAFGKPADIPYTYWNRKTGEYIK